MADKSFSDLSPEEKRALVTRYIGRNREKAKKYGAPTGPGGRPLTGAEIDKRVRSILAGRN